MLTKREMEDSLEAIAKIQELVTVLTHDLYSDPHMRWQTRQLDRANSALKHLVTARFEESLFKAEKNGGPQ